MSSGAFDKIIKENLTDSFLTLLQLHLNIHVIEAERLPALKQTTIEREVDFLAKVKTEDQQEFILHLEFQSHYEGKMVYRMAEYAAILLREYQIPVKQFVVYMGSKKVNVVSELPGNQIIKGFEWLDLGELPLVEFLDSDAPEVIILGILSDFGRLKAEEVSMRILNRLQEIKLGADSLKKYITQLEVLSNLRNLNDIVTQSIRAMPITFDIRKSSFYQEGKEEGKQEGKQEIVLNMYAKGLSVEQIVDLTGIAKDEVEKVIKASRKE